MQRRPIILVDLDGVLANFDEHFIKIWGSLYPHRPPLDQSQRTSFRIMDEFEERYRQDVASIFHSSGFFSNLPPILGAIDGFRQMVGDGYDVWICSSPMIYYRHCLVEKYQWVERELGSEWVKRIILTRQKAMILGDVLIDDNPVIPDANTAPWKQVLFDTPYNQISSPLPRMKWETWKHVLPKALAHSDLSL